MSNCPVCNTPVSADFGLAQCEQCGAHLIVHADGHVEYSGSQADEEVEPSPAFELAEQPSPPEESAGLADPVEDMAQEAESETAPPSDDLFQEDMASAEPEAPAVYSPPSTSDSPDLSDIAQFGNSDHLSRDGSLRYNLLVTGIDTADVREAFREALIDRKFVWDTDEILRSIHHGEVKIANVTAVKASVLISRLRHLPLKIKWEQYAVHQA